MSGAGQPQGVELWVLPPDALVKFLDHEPAALGPEEIALPVSALEIYIRASAEA